MYACNGILFNHDSPRRGETFVTRKITRALASIAQGSERQLCFGSEMVTHDLDLARRRALLRQHGDDLAMSTH